MGLSDKESSGGKKETRGTEDQEAILNASTKEKEKGNQPIIKICDLGKLFRSGSVEVRALDRINLEIERGEIFGIIGLSGAGKSTLVRCINYLEEPTEGDVIFEGESLRNMSEAGRRKKRQLMGMIFQQFNLLAQRNVLKNICFPMEIAGIPFEQAKKRAYELLELVGLSDKSEAYPSQLSGGQKQRVAIARAIANYPKVLLCDEATSALDPNTTKQILELIKDINKKLGITVIVITHEMKVIESICDRVAIIADSRIAELGKVSDIFSDPQSKIGKQLILGDAIQNWDRVTGKKLRITFDGRSSFEPIISNMILSCNIPINILYASTRDIKGEARGQMIVQVSDDEIEYKRVIHYLNSTKVTYEEVDSHEFG
ncbi:MAG: ATP-binding cassette domain-containing protein [Johnsonella sp.]|nr:ATP-binding cassette domain-containing protein [Johnsonella sp.]